MKKLTLSIAIFIVCISSVMAQGYGGAGMNADEVIERYITSINEEIPLSDEKNEAIRGIYKEFFEKMQEMRSSGGFDRTAMEDMRKERLEKMKAVLSEEEFEVVKDMEEKMRQERQERRQQNMNGQ